MQTFVNSQKEEQTNDLATIDSKEGIQGKNTESLGNSERSLMSSRRANDRRHTNDKPVKKVKPRTASELDQLLL